MDNAYPHGLIGRKISKFGFICGQADEESELHYMQTGKYTMLIVEGKDEPHPEYDEERYYVFYKMNTHPVYERCDILGERLDCFQIVERIEKYFKHRERFMKEKEMEKKWSKWKG